MTLEEKDCNFEKIWLGHIVEAIDEIGSKKIDVLMYLFRHRNSENIVICTNRQLADAVGVSYDTAATTLAALVRHDIIKRGVGHIVINPDVIFKGAYGKRMNILLSYRQKDDPPAQIDPRAKKADILEDIKRKVRELRQGEDFSDDDTVEILMRAVNGTKPNS
jgi:DNA-binding Lrp family transcriptional regulator